MRPILLFSLPILRLLSSISDRPLQNQALGTDYESGGQEFESLRARQYLDLYRLWHAYRVCNISVGFPRTDAPLSSVTSGRRTAAATLNGALTRIADAAALVPELPNALSRVRDSVGEMAFAAANRRGAAMPVNEAYALAEIAETLTALAAGGGAD
jgi:hypothetical protein